MNMNSSIENVDRKRSKQNGKTNSMNDGLLKKIMKDKIKKDINSSHFQDSITSKASNDINLNCTSRNGIQTYHQKDHSYTLGTEKANHSTDKLVNTIPKVPDTLIPQKKQKKNIKNDISFRNEKNFKELVIHKNTQIILEQYLETQILNKKLHNEVKSLNDKVESLKKLNIMKRNEVEMIDKKYREIIDKYNLDLEELKKGSIEQIFLKESNEKLTLCLKSTINILVDILGIVLTQKIMSSSNNLRNSINNTNNSMSLDIYDSYNNEDEKKNSLIDQISKIVNAKLTYIKNNLNIDVDKELEKLKTWNVSTMKLEDSISNIKFSMKKDITNENSFTAQKISELNFNSNSFDLNSSQKNNSPKFYNNNINNTSINELCKEYVVETDSKKNTSNMNNQTLNDSMFKDLNSLKIVEIADEKKELNNENGSLKRENKLILDLNLNDNPTDFNVEFYFSGNTNNSNVNGSNKPVIFSPIFGNHKKDLFPSNSNISFMDF